MITNKMITFSASASLFILYIQYIQCTEKVLTHKKNLHNVLCNVTILKFIDKRLTVVRLALVSNLI